jgi:F-type H+-transporting ATPase subunit delta
MIGSSRASLAVVREKVNEQYGNADLADSGRQLLDVADLLGREKQLRNALADSGRPSAERAAIVGQLLGGRTNPLTLDIVTTIASQRWSNESDLVDAVEYSGAQALFGASEMVGELDRVEDELFRFGRIVASDGPLQLALSSWALPAQAKRGILHDLLSDRATGVTTELLGFVTSHLRGRRIEQAVESLSELAAERRGKLVAIVRAARPLDDAQTTRLAAALERIYHQPVAVNTEIDPALVGGISVQIGDDVLDGTIAGRLEAAKRRIAG